MIRDRNIVCVASSWYDHPTSKHHVMRRLAAANHVVWVNFHGSRRPALSRSDAGLVLRRLRRVWAGVQTVQPGLDVLSPPVIPLPELRLARRVNAWLLARWVRAALRRRPSRPVQVWLFTPDVPELLPHLPAERIVYYCVDDFAAFSGFNTALMEQLEARTLAAADVVITTSSRLYEERRTRHPAVHLVPHGVDFEHFAAAPTWPRDRLPADVRSLPHPVLGYMGLVSDYVDLDLLAAAARARPTWTFVLVGDVRCRTDALAGLPNVHLLGGRPYELLPAYCAAFDVGLIPFRMNRLVRAVNPIKLREYLAAGLPVVSAPLSEVLRYAPAVQTAARLPEFLAACQGALELARGGRAADRQALVRDEGWDRRVAELAELVMGAGGTPTGPAGAPTPVRAAQRAAGCAAGAVRAG